MTKKLKKVATNNFLKYLQYILPSLLLLGSIFYFSWYSNIFFGNVQDAILYPYLVQDFHLHDTVLPGGHTNILKFPLFIIQAILPYNPVTLFIVNFSLVLFSVGLWCLLLINIFGKKFLPLIFSLASAFLLSSVLMQTNFTETTIRNIEYPIGLALILIIGQYLRSVKFTRKRITLAALITILFILAVAGDSFMLYAFAIPVLAMLIAYSLQSQKINRKVAYAFLYVLAIVFASIITRKLIAFTGIAELYFAESFDAKIIPFEQFFPALSHAIDQLFRLSGADIGNRFIEIQNAIYFVNLALVFVGIAGLAYIFIKTCRDYYRKSEVNTNNNFVLSTLFLSFIFTFFAYIVSGLALVAMDNGSLVNASNERYITLLPFLIIAGICVVIDNFYNSKVRATIVIVIISSIIISAPSITSSFQRIESYAQNSRKVIENVKEAALTNKVSFILSGDTLGSTVRFWSENKIKYASILKCNQYMTHNTRLSWYQEDGTPTALLVDRTGLDAQYWTGCTNEKLNSIYGQPAKIVPIDNPAGSAPIELWIYNDDVRNRTFRAR